MNEPHDDTIIFRALAHETRRALLDALRSGPMTTGALCDALPELDRCTVMQHLAVLTDANLVTPERRGRERWNHLNVVPIQAVHARWIGPFAGYSAEKLGRLDAALSETEVTVGS